MKITLADGSTVSGKVTNETDIQCGCPGHQDGDGGPGGWQHGGQGPNGGFDHGDDFRQGESTQPPCDSSSLLAGVKVEHAELSLGGSGAIWDRIDLAQQ